MTLRLRIFMAIAAVSLLTIGVSAYINYRSLSKEYEEQLTKRVDAISDSLRMEFNQIKVGLDSILDELVNQKGYLTRDFPLNRPANRYQWGTRFIQQKSLNVLKVLDPQGQILTSAHWPASFGAIDPLFEGYKARLIKSESPVSIVSEPTPEGTTASLEIWVNATTQTKAPVLVAAGRFLSNRVLEDILARTGADLIALCDTAEALCLGANSKQVPTIELKSIEDLEEIPDIHLNTFDLLLNNEESSIIVGVGVSRSNLKSLGKDLGKQALTTSILGLLLALLIGFYLSHRIGSPLSKLAHATGEVAAGDFQTRVELPQNAVKEVNSLVEGFNTMASELEQSRQKLVHAERVATWQEIARGLAHEIKNPLTPILAALSVVRRARERNLPDFDEILAEQATAVHEEVSRLKAMADNFARFARLPEPSSEPVKIHLLLSQIATLYKNTYPNIVFDIRSDNPEEVIYADADRLRTVFSNIILNAAQAMQGEGQLKISLDCGLDTIEIVLHDSGPGIASEMEDRLFLPYATNKGSAGTGLGLALAHRIITEMGGTIEINKAVATGACFKVALRKTK